MDPHEHELSLPLIEELNGKSSGEGGAHQGVTLAVMTEGLEDGAGLTLPKGIEDHLGKPVS